MPGAVNGPTPINRIEAVLIVVKETRVRATGIVVTTRRHRYPMTDDEFMDAVLNGILNRVSEVIDKSVYHNMLMNAGHNMLRDALSGAIADVKFRYLAWGTDASANVATMTKLGNEVGRRAVTRFTPGTTGVQVMTTYVTPDDGAGVSIQELGWFHSPSATAAKDSGIMNSRILYSRNKTNLESIQVDRTETFA